jgi:PhnB protein
MNMSAKPIPEGYHSLTPSLAVDDAAAAIEFYKQAFGAVERGRMPAPDGRIAHAELEIGDSLLTLADTFEQSATRPPKEVGGTTGSVLLYVEDVDTVVDHAVEAGASVTMPVEDMFWGDRYGQVTDPFGHVWQIATHKQDLSPEEAMERARTAMADLS